MSGTAERGTKRDKQRRETVERKGRKGEAKRERGTEKGKERKWRYGEREKRERKRKIVNK